MPVESDSPDHGGGNPTLPHVDHPSSLPPADGGDRAGSPSGSDQAEAPEAEVPPSPSPAAPGGAPGASDASGLGSPADNGADDVGAEQPPVPPLPRHLIEAPPAPAPALAYTGPPEAMPRPPATDPAAGLPAPPAHYRRPGPTVVGQLRRRRQPRVVAPPVEGRRVIHRLRQVSPWSVLKVAVLFYICVFLMFMVASVLLWKIGRSTETIDQVEDLVTRLGAYGRCVPEGDVAPGTDFSTDEDCPDGEVIVDGFRFNDGTLFKAELLSGGIFVISATTLTVLLVILLNLLNDVTGGVRYETVREPSPERYGPPAGAAPPEVSPGAPGPPPPPTTPVPAPPPQRAAGFGLPPNR